MDTIFVEKISFLKYFHTVKKKDEINIKVVAEVGIISFLCVDSTQDIEFFIRSYKQLLIHKYVTIFPIYYVLHLHSSHMWFYIRTYVPTRNDWKKNTISISTINLSTYTRLFDYVFLFGSPLHCEYFWFNKWLF